MFTNIELGKRGEQIAVNFLRRTAHYKIITTNFRTRWGEIDIICRRKKTLIFVEVKTRTGVGFGYPESAITPTKASHLVSAAQYYRAVTPKVIRYNWQIDAVAIEIDKTGPPTIIHVPNCVTDINTA